MLKAVSFKKKWRELKYASTNKDIDFWHNVVDIDGTVDRTMYLDRWGENLNPLYMVYFFPHCRCHWNVIFPTWLLNDRQLIGDYSVITNEKHSAIINTKTNKIYDPTYTAQNRKPDATTKMFESGHQVDNLVLHCLRVEESLFKRLVDFVTPRQRNQMIDLIKEKAVG